MTVGGLILLIVIGYLVVLVGGGMVAARIDRGYWGRSRSSWDYIPILGYGAIICLAVTLVVFVLAMLVGVIATNWGVPL